MPVCLSSLLPHPHLLYHCDPVSVFGLFLGTILTICVFFASWVSTSGSDASMPLGVSLFPLSYIGILVPFPVLMATPGSLLFISGHWLSS